MYFKSNKNYDAESIVLNTAEIKRLIQLILFLCLSQISLSTHAQNQEEFTIESVNNSLQTMHPSPTAAALGKYGSYPVSGSSGLPSISIPLFEIQGQEMTIPISLAYHGDGVHVDEIASWVGMGWSLNAGGVITRSIAGFPDESGKGIFQLYKTQGFTPDSPANGYGLGWDMMYRLSSGLQKGEPDIYSYNFLGYSGQFFIDHNENIFHYNHSDLQIKRTINLGNISQFKVTIGDGTFLIFNAIETISLDAEGQGSYSDEEVAWYLTRAVKNNDQFDFVYEEEAINEGFSCSEVGSKAITNGAGACLNVVDRQIVQGSVTTKTKQRLKYIIGPYGVTEFHESHHERADLAGTKKLDSITYMNQTIHLKSRFTNGTYKPSINCININGPGIGKQERLFLDEVELSAGNDSKRYLLNYLSPDDLPPTKSFDQDHWGYFNDANNYTLLPALDGFNAGGSREPNPNVMQYGTLQKITYPTGGFTEFEWEPNRKCVSDSAMVEICNTLVNFYSDGAFNSGVIEAFTFTLNHVADVNFNIDVGALAENTTEPGAINLSITQINGASLYSASHEFDNNQIISIDNVLPGDYSVVLENRMPAIESVSFNLEECHEELRIVTNCQYYGGLRIKEIANYSAKNEEFNKTRYQYKNLTSSRIMSTGGYSKTIKQVCSSGGGSETEYAALKRHDRSLIQFSNSVTYDTITEIFNDSSKIEYEYYQLNDNWGGNSYEAVLLQDHSWKRNLLKRKTLYNRFGTPVSENRSYYTFVSNNIYKGIKVDLILWNPFNGGNYDHQYTIGTFNLYSDWARLDSTTEINYHQNGNLIQKKAFEYFNPEDKVSPNLIRTTGSDGRTISAITLYPLDYLNTGDLWENLKTKYFHHPIEKVIIRNAEVTKASIYQYDLRGNLISNRILVKNKPIPKSEFEFSNQSDPSIKGYFLASEEYNSENEINLSYDGNLLVNKLSRQGLNVSYIWAYNGKYPVAEIINYSADQTVSLIGQSKIDEIKNSFNNTFIESELRTVQQQLPHSAQLSIYLYKGGIGVIKTIDPNGNSSQYRYDDFGRLKSISDNDGNLLSSFDYQYSLETK
ncbi:RHS repeat domain-containing protein [Ekhidna sp.]|uniref:RHS repeat domain-containing protein n=1 Tax=Ekhidna sp. TaxID=2608089 RepID=UPI003298D166